MSEPIEYNQSPSGQNIVLEAKRMGLDAGWLGICFGGTKTAPTNISGFLVVVLAVAGIALLFIKDTQISAKDFWPIIVPILTLVMGFLFGKGGGSGTD